MVKPKRKGPKPRAPQLRKAVKQTARRVATVVERKLAAPDAKQMAARARTTLGIQNGAWRDGFHAVADGVGSLIPGGGLLAAGAKSLFGHITGLGSYTIRGQPLRNNLSFSRGPSTCVVEHREFITDIVTSSTANGFTLSTYNINPASATTFPWLSAVAKQFQEWRPEGILFEFKSTSSDALNSTNTALGSVMAGVAYDPNHNFSALTPTAVLGLDGVSETKPSQSFLVPVESKGRLNTRTNYDIYVDTDNLENSSPGTLLLGTNGFQGTSVRVGQLWVVYKIRLSKPYVPFDALDRRGTNTTITSLSRLFQGSSHYAYFSGSPVSSAAPMGPDGTYIIRTGGDMFTPTTDASGLPVAVVSSGSAVSGKFIVKLDSTASSLNKGTKYYGRSYLALALFNAPSSSSSAVGINWLGVSPVSCYGPNGAITSAFTANGTTQAVLSVVLTADVLGPGSTMDIEFSNSATNYASATYTVWLIALPAGYVDSQSVSPASVLAKEELQQAVRAALDEQVEHEYCELKCQPTPVSIPPRPFLRV